MCAYEVRETPRAEAPFWMRFCDEEPWWSVYTELLMSPDRKAYRLLIEHLTPEQLQSLNENRCWYLRTARHLYRFGLDDQVRIESSTWTYDRYLCVVSCEAHEYRGALPQGDMVLVNMLALQADEEQFLEIANTDRSWK